MQFLPIYSRSGIVDHAVVDDEDFELLDEFNWHLHPYGYAVTSFSSGRRPNRVHQKGFMHRMVMNPPEGMEVDHVNHDPLDNRKLNLRIATSSQNHQNQRSKGDFKGVWWDASRQKWQARIKISRKTKHLGRFGTAKEAAAAYNTAAVELFGEFALLNQL